MIIRTFGLYWNVEDVYWGGRNNTGRLLGTRIDNRDINVDFREQSGVYALYAEYDLVYIGQTGRNHQRLFSRLKQHTRDFLANRWNKFSWFGTRYVLQNHSLSNDRNIAATKHIDVLNHMEAILISVSEPPLNRQSGRWGERVHQFLQYRDDELGPSQQEMLESLWRQSQNK